MFIPSLVITEDKMLLDIAVEDYVSFMNARLAAVRENTELISYRDLWYKGEPLSEYRNSHLEPTQKAFDNYLFNWWSKQPSSTERTYYFQGLLLEAKHKDKKFPDDVLLEFTGRVSSPSVGPAKTEKFRVEEEKEKFYDTTLGVPWGEDGLPEMPEEDRILEDRCTIGSLQVGECCNYYLRTTDFTGEIAFIVTDLNSGTGPQLQTSRGFKFQANTHWKCRRITTEKFLEEEADYDKYLFERETFDERSRRDGKFIATQLKDITDSIYLSTPTFSGSTEDKVEGVEALTRFGKSEDIKEAIEATYEGFGSWVPALDDTPRHLHGVSPYEAAEAYAEGYARKIEMGMLEAGSFPESELPAPIGFSMSSFDPKKSDLDGLVLTYIESARRAAASSSGPIRRLCDEVNFWRRKYLGDYYAGCTEEVIEKTLRELKEG